MAGWGRLGWLLGGWLLGVVTAGSVAALAATGIASRGLVVPVAVGHVTERVQGEVEAAVLDQLPGAVAALKQEVPPRVAAELRRRLSAGDFRLGEVPLTVPPELLGTPFDAQVEATVRSALDQLGGQEAAAAAAKAVSGRVAAAVRHQLAAEVADWRFTLRPWRYLAVPVTLQPQP